VSHDDFDVEPIPGLPERPPAGEEILWQGAPQWQRVAREVYYVDKVAIYFAALLGLKFAAELWSGASAMAALRATAGAAVWMVPLGLAAIGVLMVLAYLTGRTTIYTITNQRVAIRFGIALPMTVNLPFRTIDTVALNVHADGTGNIPISLLTGDRIAYLVMWPHTRPWRFSKPEPMLRAVPDAARVAKLLSDAISNASAQSPSAAKPEGQAVTAAPAVDPAQPPMQPPVAMAS